MTIQVHCPNGTCLEFPDGTPQEVIEAKRAEFGGAAEPSPMAMPPEAVLGIVQGVANVAQSLAQQVAMLQQAAAQMAQAAQMIVEATQASVQASQMTAQSAREIAGAAARVPEFQAAVAAQASRVEAAIMAPTEVVRDKGRVVGARKKRGG